MSPIPDSQSELARMNLDNGFFTSIWRFIMGVFSALNTFLDHAASGIEQAVAQTGEVLKNFFTYLANYPLHAFHAVDHLLKSHPYLSLLVLSLIFFGPVLLLLPLIIFEELVLMVAYNAAISLHGLFLHGRPSRWYRELRRPHFRQRDSVFHKCQLYTEAYNRKTTENRPLLVFRVICAAVAVYVVVLLAISWA
ncbi:hypothetical protein HGRIS_007159 [Hohenbuehelia grisea]|uniref:Uncharacterized protein n=1 Tax=Hohenbuehelia grisea TaxID=104357 RepID=A0ABR3JCV3_9AGAR